MKKEWMALVACIVLVWILSLQAGDKGSSIQVSKHSYIGAAKCKMCHLKQYKAWSAGKMATAYAALKESDAKDPKCVKCHVTGYDKGGYAIGGANDPDLTNVQCEVCHGPGSDYKSVMKDKAIAAGLVIPDEKVCVACHNKENPNFKEINFDKMRDKVHPIAKR